MPEESASERAQRDGGARGGETEKGRRERPGFRCTIIEFFNPPFFSHFFAPPPRLLVAAAENYPGDPPPGKTSTPTPTPTATFA